MKWMSPLIALVLTLGFLGGCTPVGGKKDVNQPGKATMDEAEKKLSSDLLALVNEAFLPENTSKDAYLKQQKELGTVLEATANGATALCAYVYVQLAQDAPMDAVTPYLFELRNSDEKNRLLACYVEVSRLKEVAVCQEVVSIRAVDAPITK